MRATLPRAILGGLVLACGASARAEDPPQRHGPFAFIHQRLEGNVPPGRPRNIPHTDERAGYPRCLANHLQPTNTPGGIGYYVGGSVPAAKYHTYDGACRQYNDGTWGWDETGLPHCRRRVILGWAHGARYQGGTGAYRTDGPVVPDLVYATTSAIGSVTRHRKGGEGGEGSEE